MKAQRGVRRLSIGDGNARSVGSVGMAFFEALRVRGFAEATVRNREVAVARFAQWCLDRGVVELVEITRPVVERYQRWLFYFRRDDDKPLSLRVQYNHLIGLKQFLKWATRQNLMLHNPASELVLPKLEKPLPRVVLALGEAEQVMATPDVANVLGLRDRAMLEVLYSTGIRRTELTNLGIYDVDRARGLVSIRCGKGKKDRIIPVGERALMWVQRYLDEVRPSLAMAPDGGTLFLSSDGGPLTPMFLSELVGRYIDRAEIGKKGSCHVFRHTMATLMLENGADIRFIQAMLGHSDLSTTEIYTRVSVGKLKEIHAATHPGASLGKREASSATDADELLAALDGEAQEEAG